MANNENIKELLNTFEKYWLESLNGDYKNGPNLKNLSLQIKKSNISKDIILNLTVTERTALAHALLLANI